MLCDTYGGAINKIAADATAFVHRANTRYVMQYYMQWDSASATNANIAMMRTLYASMRPFVSGGCYVNYCDLDLGDGYAKAYWGDNLAETDEDQGGGRSEKHLQACPERAAELKVRRPGPCFLAGTSIISPPARRHSRCLQGAPRAACSMTFATARGCEKKIAWLPLISVTLAPARLYIERSRSGFIIRSCVATMP